MRTPPRICLFLVIGIAALTTDANGQGESNVITDIQGRSIKAVILAVDGAKITARRESDGLEFSIPLEKLSDETRKNLRNFSKPESPDAVPANARKHSKIDPSLPDGMLSTFRYRWEETRKSIPDPGNEKSKFTYRHHSELFALERNLILAASPKDPAAPIDWPDSVNSRTRTEAEALRQKIRDAEREPIVNPADPEEKDARGSRRNKQRSDSVRSPVEYRDHSAFNDLYDRTTRKLRSDLGRAQKAIARENKSATPRDSVLSESHEKVKSTEELIQSIHEAFYGYKPGQGLNRQPDWPEDHEVEVLRKEIHTLRMAVLAKLRAGRNHDGESEYRIAEIGGIEIYSSNFGVILDVSGSMRSHIDPLKKEIEESFQSPLYREINGCSLRVIPSSQASGFARSNDTLGAIEEMIMVHEVDTIYWFCDLQDLREPQAIQRLRELLNMSGAKFYVRSVGKDPDSALKSLIHEF